MCVRKRNVTRLKETNQNDAKQHIYTYSTVQHSQHTKSVNGIYSIKKSTVLELLVPFFVGEKRRSEENKCDREMKVKRG